MKLICPECGEELVYNGYRPLFPVCKSCEKDFHIDDCLKE